tara:strand:+ start:24 stop:581 length:558 start_codon:yes stop_codon:yes gene_type:complete
MRTKMNIKLKLESYLEGGYPIRECIDFFTFSELDFYDELIDLISSSKKEEALDLATKNFGGYYHISNVESLDEKGFKFLETEDVSLNDPFIEELKGGKRIPLFRWIGASFILEGPKEIISNWMDKDGDRYEFNKELFEEWMEENGGDDLQDGCGYALGEVAYDLEGFGTHGCDIDKYFIEDSFNN